MALIWNKNKYKQLCDHWQNMMAAAGKKGEQLRASSQIIQEKKILLVRVQRAVHTTVEIETLNKEIKSLQDERSQLQKEYDEYQLKLSRVGALKNECDNFLRSKGIEEGGK